MDKKTLEINYIDLADFKNSPTKSLEESKGLPVCILNQGKTLFYCIPPDHWEAILNTLEDNELSAIAKRRKDEKSIKVCISEL